MAFQSSGSRPRWTRSSYDMSPTCGKITPYVFRDNVAAESGGHLGSQGRFKYRGFAGEVGFQTLFDVYGIPHRSPLEADALTGC